MTQGWEVGLGAGDSATTRPQHGHEACDTAETMAYDMTGLRAGHAQRARAWPGQGESRDTKLCIVAEGRPCVTIQCSQGLRYDAQRHATRRRGVATREAARATRRAAGARVAIQFLYRD